MTDPVRDLGQDVAEALGTSPDDERIAQQRSRLLAQTGSGFNRGSRRSWMLAPAVAGAGALIAVVVLWWHQPTEPDDEALGCTANGLDVSEGQWLHPQTRDTVDVQFSEGSRVTLEPRARVRLSKLQSESIHLSIEGGTVDSDITSGKGISWTFLAGPYRVAVLGTQLRIEWEPEIQRLAVVVTEGQVRVLGAQLGEEGLAVSGGQRLEASTESVHLGLTTLPEVAGNLQMDASLAAPEREQIEPSETPPEQHASRWGELANEGRYAEAVAAAEREGYSRLVQQLPAYELLELADSARLSGNGRRARQALLWLRVRFPGQRPAHVAAFRLGRLAYDHERNFGEAARWFDTVIREAPSGPHTADARGRLMDALNRQGRRAQAAQVAREYLERHPGGAYEATARSLVSDEVEE